MRDLTDKEMEAASGGGWQGQDVFGDSLRGAMLQNGFQGGPLAVDDYLEWAVGISPVAEVSAAALPQAFVKTTQPLPNVGARLNLDTVSEPITPSYRKGPGYAPRIGNGLTRPHTHSWKTPYLSRR